MSAITERDAERVPGEPVYGYDLRKGAKIYAPIVGTLGGFAVTAVTLVVTLAAGKPRTHSVALGYATGMLVLGLIGCLMGSFIFTTIAGERRLAATLPPALLFTAAGTSIAVVAILAAFEILASLYLPQTKDLFAMITGASEIGAAMLVSLSLADAWSTGPTNIQAWVDEQWLGTSAKAVPCAKKASGLTGAVVLVGIALYFTDATVSLGSTGVQIFVGAGIVLSGLGSLAGLWRTIPTENALDQKGVRKGEAVLALGAMTAYFVLLMVFLP